MESFGFTRESGLWSEMYNYDLTGCSKRQPTRPQTREDPEAYPLGYVEDFVEARTKLGVFFSSRRRGSMSAIREIKGRQILDSRGNPTVEAE